ncbi:tryptophan--tRNA ligase [Puia dinghuensis]|uniref:Tryptophan--tRNA ligase n=2 Tax=Puia dinghuensis TaxID=1792502 RepID=A0A8J2XTC4_9BACT|nr:tryptophan--tRNA ligase [Puia dinghuensis]
MSGIRPTGFLHLGNYFGAVRNYVRMQDAYTCYFMVADLHALTTLNETRELKGHVRRVMAENIASGLDPERVAFYCQSHVPETSELYLLLNMLAYVGELEKTPTFKEKVRLQPQNVNAGLLTYPVLQAADILLHRATLVPVGKDQEQHLEIARNYVNRFNGRYGEVFPEPYAFNFGEALIKVPSLDGAGKMSKSENQMATIYLADDDATIRKKIAKAKTDSGPAVSGASGVVQPGGESGASGVQSGGESGAGRSGGKSGAVQRGMMPGIPMSESVANLFLLLRLVSSEDVVQKFSADYEAGTIRYGDMKKELAEGMVRFVAPIREKAEAIQNDDAYLRRVMEEGAAKARSSAKVTIGLVKDAIGLNYY